jgi:hypothetical protein
MTTHEFDAYCDTLPAEHFEPPYHEQLLVMQEFEMTRETVLKKQGAREALEAVYSKIAKLMWNNPSTSTGIWLAHREIKEQLAIL